MDTGRYGGQGQELNRNESVVTMSKFFSLAALVVGGIIVADILTHPVGTAAASKGVAGITNPAIQGLLGK